MLLHNTRNPPLQSSNSPTTAIAALPNEDQPIHQHHHFAKSFSLFRYVPVTIRGNGREVNIFAFLDEGSTSTLLEAGRAEQLGIDGPSETLWLSWTEQISREEKESRKICVTVSGTGLKQKYTIDNVLPVGDMELPQQSFCYRSMSEQFPHLKGLPIASYTNVAPRMIIELEHVRLLTTLKLREGKDHDLVAVKTRLGWCVYGRNSMGEDMSCQVNIHYNETISNQALHEMMKQFFFIDESTVTNKLDSEDDKRALEILERTSGKKEGRYETGLLWKTDKPFFPDSFPMAMKRLISLEKRLAHNPALKASSHSFRSVPLP